MVTRFCFIVVFQMLVLACGGKREEKAIVHAATTVNEYPDLSLLMEGGEKVSTKTLKGKNIFVFFQPDCDHCQQEASEIRQRLDEFRNYTLYFISSGSMPQIIQFAEQFGLHDKPNVKFAWTSTEGVLNYYGPIQTPSIYIYAEGKLLKSFNGSTDVENIINSL